MQFAGRGLGHLWRSTLVRNFAKKKNRKVKIIERDEYDLTTALNLIKAESVTGKDESIDVLIK